MRLTILLWLALGMLCSCDPTPTGPVFIPEESPCIDVNKIEVTTGLQFNNLEGVAIRSWKSPNDVNATGLRVMAYPNPTLDVLKITSEIPVTNYWIIASGCPNECDDQAFRPEEITGASIDKDELLFKSEMQGDLAHALESFQLNVEELPLGIYKLFMELENGELVWQNILKLDQPSTVEGILRYLSNDCIQ